MDVSFNQTDSETNRVPNRGNQDKEDRDKSVKNQGNPAKTSTMENLQKNQSRNNKLLFDKINMLEKKIKKAFARMKRMEKEVSFSVVPFKVKLLDDF